MAEKLLAGKKAIITGASSGVGKSTAALFTEHGASVGLIARRDDVLKEHCASLGDRAFYAAADIANDEQVAAAVASLDEQMGGIDILINAAGMDGPAPLKDLTPDVWRRQIDVNLSGTFYVTRECALRMQASETKGVIINLGSELSLIGMAWFSHYCASKFGVIGLTKALAHELSPDIRVNCICPGPIDTPMMDAELEWFPDPEETRKQAIERVPLKRFATPQEISDAVLYFVTGATYATGSIFSIDGGTTAI